jgi:hypothetical protein
MNLVNHLPHRVSNARVALMTLFASFCMTCTLLAQETGPQQTPNDTELGQFQPDLSKIHPELADLAKEIIDQTQNLRKEVESNGPDHPSVANARKQLDATRKLYLLQQKRIPLRVLPRDENQAAEYEHLTKQIATAKEELAQLKSFDDSIKAGELRRPNLELQASAKLQQDLQRTAQHLAAREMQLAQVAKQLAQRERDRDLPSIENAELKIFALRSVPAANAAGAIDTLFGARDMRVAVDDRTNSLIALGKQDSLKAIEALLMRLDQSEVADDGSKQSQPGQPTNRSLLLRLFWLADGLPDGEGSDPSEVLPASVMRATKKLGLQTPRLVAQTVNSLAVGSGEKVDFSTNIPAMLLKQMVGLNTNGKVKMVGNDRAGLEMHIHVMGQHVNCELQGSLATPLGHYMVLGTANSLIAEYVPNVGMEGGAMGPEGGAPGGFRGPQTFGRGEFGGAMPGAAMGEGGVPQPEPKFTTSRFAFVVQVIEGESFPPDDR